MMMLLLWIYESSGLDHDPSYLQQKIFHMFSLLTVTTVAKCSYFVQRICRQHTSTSVSAVDFSALRVSRSSFFCHFCWLFCSFHKQIQFWFVRFIVFVDWRVRFFFLFPRLISGRWLCSLFSLTNFGSVRRFFSWRYIGSVRMFKNRSWLV